MTARDKIGIIIRVHEHVNQAYELFRPLLDSYRQGELDKLVMRWESMIGRKHIECSTEEQKERS